MTQCSRAETQETQPPIHTDEHRWGVETTREVDDGKAMWNGNYTIVG